MLLTAFLCSIITRVRVMRTEVVNAMNIRRILPTCQILMYITRVSFQRASTKVEKTLIKCQIRVLITVILLWRRQSRKSKNIKCLKQSSNSTKEMNITVGENVYKYLPCRKFFNQISNQNTLYKTCPWKEHTCKDCGKTGPWFSGVTLHRNGYPGQNPDMCNDCGKAFWITSTPPNHHKSTLDTSLTNVDNVLKLLPSPQISEIIRKLIKERNFSNVVKVAVPLQVL